MGLSHTYFQHSADANWSYLPSRRVIAKCLKALEEDILQVSILPYCH